MLGRRSGIAIVVMLVVCACAQTPARVPESNGAATAEPDSATSVTGVEGHFDPTEAAGGGANAGVAISPADLATMFAAIPNAGQLDLTANSSPPGAAGVDIMSISVVGTATGGLFKSLDESAKRALGDALLTTAATRWPNASVSLLLTDPSGAGGQIIGTRVKDGSNTLIVS